MHNDIENYKLISGKLKKDLKFKQSKRRIVHFFTNNLLYIPTVKTLSRNSQWISNPKQDSKVHRMFFFYSDKGYNPQ